jgi:hypothetical protein
MNDRANGVANAARIGAQSVRQSEPLRLYGEETHRMTVDRVPV